MKRAAILYLCILLSVLFVVRCNADDDDDEDEIVNNNSYGDYEPPTKEYATDPKIISRDVKCLGNDSSHFSEEIVLKNSVLYILVCQATVLEMEKEIKKVDPRKKVEVSGFRMDSDGFSEVKSVQYSRSETFLTELMDTICKQFYPIVR